MNILPKGYELVTGAERIDPVAAHAYLTRSYWSPGIPLEIVTRAINNSIVVAITKDNQQVGMARVVSDHATFAYLADVYVLEEHQGLGLAKAMVTALHDHPDLQGLRRWLLGTLDAHSLYEGLGWNRIAEPARFMERVFPDIYKTHS